MITIATLLWDANAHSFDFSTMYDESWVEKLYRGVQRNLTQPFRFICWSEKPRAFFCPIETRILDAKEPDYGSCIQPYELGEPMILVGLDTVITGSIDHLADYCAQGGELALPRDPNGPYMACNGVSLCPGDKSIWLDHDGRNDMAWMRSRPHVFIDDLFPGHVRSWKGGELPGVRDTGLQDTRICYLHGDQKMHQIQEPWLLKHWA